MKIDSKFNPIREDKDNNNQTADPFDLDINSTEIKIAYHPTASPNTWVVCPPHITRMTCVSVCGTCASCASCATCVNC